MNNHKKNLIRTVNLFTLVLLTVLLSFNLSSANYSADVMEPNDNFNNSSIPKPSYYVETTALEATNDAGLETLASSGTGSEISPFIIEGLVSSLSFFN